MRISIGVSDTSRMWKCFARMTLALRLHFHPYHLGSLDLLEHSLMESHSSAEEPEQPTQAALLIQPVTIAPGMPSVSQQLAAAFGAPDLRSQPASPLIAT